MDLENPAAWTNAFETFFASFAQFFQRSETRASVQLYLRGLLGNASRKNCWQLAESVGLPDPHQLQRVLNEAKWDADAVCQQLRAIVHETLGYEPGIGVIDESGVVKKGQKSAGVGRQYCGHVGKVENCQVGVYLGYVTPHGAAFLDRRLYVPAKWFDDQDRCQAAHIPDTVMFQTKPQLAQAMLAQAWAEGLPLQWVTGDTLYGNSPTLRDFIEQANRYYVLTLGAHHHVRRRGDEQPYPLAHLRQEVDETQWQRFVARLSDHGPVAYDWAAQRVFMPNDQVGEQWLLLQRTCDGPIEYHYHLSNAPADTPLVELVTVALANHPIEQLLEEAKGEVGLADYEVRHWHGWYRHITLVLLAHTWLKLIQHHEREKKAVCPPG
jgi:SRSO17 transposase